MLSESVYGRAWHAALSLWLDATSAPTEVGARAATASVFCTRVYLHCIESQEDLVSRQIEDALDADTSSRWS
jgi:hypothetical protein